MECRTPLVGAWLVTCLREEPIYAGQHTVGECHTTDKCIWKTQQMQEKYSLVMKL
jgi:hypothetical protein